MFSDILKGLRAKVGISQGQLAKAVGVSPGNVSDWELGKTKPGYAALSSLARFFEVTADYLLELEIVPGKKGIDLSEIKRAQGLSCDGSPLSEDEADLIAMYRLIDKRDQRTLLDLTKLKYQQLTKDPLEPLAEEIPKAEEEGRIPYAAHGWANITPEADALIQEKLRQFEKRAQELKGR